MLDSRIRIIYEHDNSRTIVLDGKPATPEQVRDAFQDMEREYRDLLEITSAMRDELAKVDKFVRGLGYVRPDELNV